jgi:hypothetical protein
MCDDKFNESELTILYNISYLNPFKLLDYLEESRCYAESNIEMRKKMIQDEMRYVWKNNELSPSSKKYIKQMNREIRIFNEREETLSHLMQKIRSGEFTDNEDEIDKEMEAEGKQLCRDMLASLKGEG